MEAMNIDLMDWVPAPKEWSKIDEISDAYPVLPYNWAANLFCTD